jgi:hypothetical protein
MRPIKSALLAALALFGLHSAPVRGQDVVVGANVVNPIRSSRLLKNLVLERFS